jgi:hypothetical protein
MQRKAACGLLFCCSFFVSRTPVGARLAGDSVLEIAIAGKPCSYNYNPFFWGHSLFLVIAGYERLVTVSRFTIY